MNRRTWFAALFTPLLPVHKPILLLRPVNSPFARLMAGSKWLRFHNGALIAAGPFTVSKFNSLLDGLRDHGLIQR